MHHLCLLSSIRDRGNVLKVPVSFKAISRNCCDHGPGSGATSLGAIFESADKSIWVGSSNEGTILNGTTLKMNSVLFDVNGSRR